MNQKMLSKHWTSLLGVLLVLAAAITLFRYTIDQGWLTDTLKIGIGLLSGAGIALGGYAWVLKNRNQLVGELGIGLGTSILYATFSFAGIYYGLWTPMTVLLGMTAITVLLVLFSLRRDSRLLMNIALAGALLSPMMMRPETDQVFTLFLYLLIVNAAFFFLSIYKKWTELRVVAFFGTWTLYAVYFLAFDPGMEGLWSKPIRYAIAAFVFYLAGFLVASWKNGRCFDGANLYLSLVNGVGFGCWALLIWDGDVPYGVTLTAIGLLYAAAGLLVHRLSGSFAAYAASHAGGGALLLLIALAQLGNGWEAKPLINTYLWIGIALAAAVIGRLKNWPLGEGAAVIVWFAVGIYWFAVTWDTPRGDWFGVYVPFLNGGALAWMLLAAMGFYFSARAASGPLPDGRGQGTSHLFAILSHAVVGGLLTLQIVNVYDIYAPEAGDTAKQLALSISWGVYALLLTLWGSYRKQAVFRWFGSFILGIVALKAIFLDLSGENGLFKAGVLLALGAIAFLISWVNGRWGGASDGKPEAAELREI
ncbi:DUF2339 domain-containing protein [Cohnella fermenti]|uniref:DUF2339 domain-containing protein n=1 Tax=Cohnella fermenti TaxID=2565925 RepID=A0A4S4C4V8_9BACL|nr:DUF2339 domain-containing protein [Cohnella fermenti]THF80731.1 DUF2339 domain-containing protein [Cohnella fermenti]